MFIRHRSSSPEVTQELEGENRARKVIDETHKTLKEIIPPNMEEIITIGIIKPEDIEYQMLLKSGLDPSYIIGGKIKRGDLLKAGFILINKIGGGEKPIIACIINGVDFSKRILITEDELNTIKKYQQDNNIFPKDASKIDAITKDMILALEANNPQEHKRIVPQDFALANLSFRKLNKSKDLPDDIIHRISHLFLTKSLIPHSKKPFFDNLDLYNILFRDIITEPAEKINGAPKKFRTVYLNPISLSRGSRRIKLKGATSPFLDNGFHFEYNEDEVLILPNGKTVRLNYVVAHLASRGLSEMSSENTAHDQHYITIDEYVRYIYSSEQEATESEIQKLANKLEFEEDKYLLKIQIRLLQIALFLFPDDESIKPLLPKIENYLIKKGYPTVLPDQLITDYFSFIREKENFKETYPINILNPNEVKKYRTKIDISPVEASKEYFEIYPVDIIKLLPTLKPADNPPNFLMNNPYMLPENIEILVKFKTQTKWKRVGAIFFSVDGTDSVLIVGYDSPYRHDFIIGNHHRELFEFCIALKSD